MNLELGPPGAHAGQASRVRALYFGYYMALGAVSPYIPLYYQRAGFSGVQIGILAALILVVSSLTAVPWGALADHFQAHRRILTAAFVLGPMLMFLVSRASDFKWMMLLVTVYAFAAAPIIPLLDSSALEAVRTGGVTYGEMRVGGSLGWIISVWGVGMLIQAFDVRWLFYAYIGCMVMTLVYILIRPPQRGSLQVPVWSNLRLLVSQPAVAFFLLSIFLVAVGSGGVMSFFSLYLDGIGAREGTIGLAWAVAAISEIPVMLYAGSLMQRIGSGGLLKIAFFIYALRWMLFSYIQSPGLAVAVQLLHGLSFAAFLTAGVTYLNERTPPGFATTAQAVFNAVAFGLASIVGSLWGGYLYDEVGMPSMLRIFSLVSVAGLFVFWISANRGSAAYASHA